MTDMMWLILPVNMVTLLGVVLTLYKIRKIHLTLFQTAERTNKIEREVKSLYSQFQAYADLIRVLKFDSALPALRGWAASPDFLLEITRHALEVKPTICAECSSGVSTVVLARCLQMNGKGHVYSLEHDPQYAEKTRRELARHGLSSWASVIDAPLTEITDMPGYRWYSLGQLPVLEKAIELLVIDGPPRDTCPLARYPALRQLKPRLADDCVVFLDDAFREDEQATLKRWLADSPIHQAEMIPCEKGCIKLFKRDTGPYIKTNYEVGRCLGQAL